MSAFADALKGIQQLLVMRERIDRLEAASGAIGDDLTGLADGLHQIDSRVARLEGFIEGAAAAASPRRTRLPRT